MRKIFAKHMIKPQYTDLAKIYEKKFKNRQLTISFSKKKKHALAGIAQWIEQGPVNQRSPVGFPVRARAWVMGQVPSRGCARGNHTLMFLSLSFSFPFSLS